MDRRSVLVEPMPLPFNFSCKSAKGPERFAAIYGYFLFPLFLIVVVDVVFVGILNETKVAIQNPLWRCQN